MADHSKIEWTDASWNPVTGCTKVSAGCDHCYAERVTERFLGPGSFAEVTLHPDRLDMPLRWRRPRRVFVNSMSDLFHEQVPDEFIARVFAVMATSYRHTFQILTKRHGRMRSLLNSQDFVRLFDVEYCRIPDWNDRWPDADYAPAGHVSHLMDGPLSNVHLLVSVEDQHWADIRIPALLDTPAAVRGLSCEPLLGPIDLRGALGFSYTDDGTGERIPVPSVDWVIVGGESGPGARPMHPDWARSIRDQCVAAGVPFFMKQTGAVLAREWGLTSRAGSDPGEWPEVFPQEYPTLVAT